MIHNNNFMIRNIVILSSSSITIICGYWSYYWYIKTSKSTLLLLENDDNNNNQVEQKQQQQKSHHNNNKNDDTIFLLSIGQRIWDIIILSCQQLRSSSSSSLSTSSSASQHNNVNNKNKWNNNNNINHYSNVNNENYYKMKWENYITNKSIIDHVIDYWFIQYGTPDIALKKLWMIPSQQKQYRNDIDYDITKQFSSYLMKLISNNNNTNSDNAQHNHGTNLWKEWCGINSSSYNDDDNQIDINDDNNTNNNTKNIYGYQGILAAIIILDQFSRHIHRYKIELMNHENNDNDIINNVLQLLPEQSIIDQLAYITSTLFIKEYGNILQNSSMIIPLPQYIFALMPYRHANTMDNINIVQYHIEHIMNNVYHKQHDNMMRNFRNATNRRHTILQDTIRRSNIIINTKTETKTKASISAIPNDNNHDTSNNENDNSRKNNENNDIILFSDDDILEFFPFNTDMIPSKDHVITQTICHFLQELGIYPTSTSSTSSTTTSDHNDTISNGNNGTKKKSSKQNNKNGKMKNNQKSFQLLSNKKPNISTEKEDVTSIDDTTIQITTTENVNISIDQSSVKNDKIDVQEEEVVPIIVSLSGGVDSMVIIRVLSYLQSNCGYNQLRIIGIHIDYANRIESKSEALYVQNFCQQQCNNIDYYCRRIDEVTRDITERNIYEKIARTIRYDFYKEIINLYQNNDNNNKQLGIGIWLGHHRGDVRENVLSNAHKGCGPLDLSGMTLISKNDGVILYRPLLTLEKTIIFDYAHTFGVPYFKDTTPNWSTRGKLRNKLLPLLEEIYGNGCMNNLNHLAIESDDCRTLLYETLINPFMKHISYDKMGIYFPISLYQHLCLYFWKFILREILHSIQLSMFTDKSVEYCFVQRIQAKPIILEGWLQCHKEYAVYLRSDGTVFILYPKSFPWNKKTYYSFTNINKNITTNTISSTTTNAHDDSNLMHVHYGEDNTIQIGPWCISAIIVNDGNSNSNTNHDDEMMNELTHQKAITSMEMFMKGKIVYYIQVPTYCRSLEENNDNNNSTTESSSSSWYPRPLIFTKFTKETRPYAWKNVDTKIQEILPIVGNDEIARDDLKDILSGPDRYNTNNPPIFLVQVTIQLSETESEVRKATIM